jgi:ribosome-binding protein aMBF1 (putative translation factor)
MTDIIYTMHGKPKRKRGLSQDKLAREVGVVYNTVVKIESCGISDPRGVARNLTEPKKVGHWGNGNMR